MLMTNVFKCIKMGHLKNALVTKKQVRSLQVTVYDPVVVEVCDSAKQLHHQRLHFTDYKRFLHVLHKRLEVVFDIVHHYVDLIHVTANHYFLHIDIISAR